MVSCSFLPVMTASQNYDCMSYFEARLYWLATKENWTLLIVLNHINCLQADNQNLPPGSDCNIWPQQVNIFSMEKI